MSYREARHPDTGETIRAYATKELDEELAELAKPCLHQNHQVRRIPIANGTTQICDVCLECGTKLSQPQPKANFSSLPEIFDSQHLARSSSKQKEKSRFEIISRHKNYDDKEKSKFDDEYREYLKSKEWLNKKELVLKRADFICEGCMQEPATEIHHTTYAHKFYEFLFELVALCPTCHSLIHMDKNPKLRSRNRSGEENIICWACRWSTEQGHEMWCTVHNVPSLASLQSENYCDNGRNGFEGLK